MEEKVTGSWTDLIDNNKNYEESVEQYEKELQEEENTKGLIEYSDSQIAYFTYTDFALQGTSYPADPLLECFQCRHCEKLVPPRSCQGHTKETCGKLISKVFPEGRTLDGRTLTGENSPGSGNETSMESGSDEETTERSSVTAEESIVSDDDAMDPPMKRKLRSDDDAKDPPNKRLCRRNAKPDSLNVTAAELPTCFSKFDFDKLRGGGVSSQEMQSSCQPLVNQDANNLSNLQKISPKENYVKAPHQSELSLKAILFTGIPEEQSSEKNSSEESSDSDGDIPFVSMSQVSKDGRYILQRIEPDFSVEKTKDPFWQEFQKAVKKKLASHREMISKSKN